MGHRALRSALRVLVPGLAAVSIGCAPRPTAMTAAPSHDELPSSRATQRISAVNVAVEHGDDVPRELWLSDFKLELTPEEQAAVDRQKPTYDFLALYRAPGDPNQPLMKSSVRVDVSNRGISKELSGTQRAWQGAASLLPPPTLVRTDTFLVKRFAGHGHPKELSTSGPPQRVTVGYGPASTKSVARKHREP